MMVIALVLLMLLPFSLASAAEEAPPSPIFPSAEECARQWINIMGSAGEERVHALCQCIEDKQRAYPLDAGKAGNLSGAGGMDSAGPWPNIHEQCLQPFLSGGEIDSSGERRN